MWNFNLILPMLFSQASHHGNSGIGPQPADAIDSVLAATAALIILVLLPVLLRLVYKQDKTEAQTIEDPKRRFATFCRRSLHRPLRQERCQQRNCSPINPDICR